MMLIITIAYDVEKRTATWGPLATDSVLQINLLDVARALNLVQQEVFGRLETTTSDEKESNDEMA